MKKTCATLIRLIGASALLVTSGCFDPFSYGTRAGGGSVPDVVAYEGDVYPILVARCSACHQPQGSAGGTSFVLSSDSGADYTNVSSLVTPGDPAASLLLQKGSGATSHGGGGLLAETSTEYKTIAAWIEEGAAQQ